MTALMCLECGNRNTQCFVHSGVNPNRTDIYALFCNTCNKEQDRKEVLIVSTGKEIAPGVELWQETHCPFCGKSSKNHASMILPEPEPESADEDDDSVTPDDESAVELILEDD